MKILNLDMDIFQNKICYKINEDGHRPSSDEFTAWNKKKFVKFIEEELGLTTTNKQKGCVVKDHHHIFYYIKNKIEREEIQIPFEMTHIDAHFDMGYMPDSTWEYITTCYMKKSVCERYSPNLLNDFYTYSSFGCSNYLLYMAANGWFSNLTYVFHPELEKYDFPPYYIKSNDRSRTSFTLGLNRINRGELSIETKSIFDIYKDCEIEVAIKCIPLSKFASSKDFNFICVSHSPTYSCESVDGLLEVLKDYIDIEFTQD